MQNPSSVGLFKLHVLFDSLDLHKTNKSVSDWVWIFFHLMCLLHLKPFYFIQFAVCPQRSKIAHCKSSILIFFLLLFVLFFIFHWTPPLLSFLHFPHCLHGAATVWLYCRHWPRPLRRPKSNILTCLLPEWWFIKKLNWLRKRIDWTQVIIIIVTHYYYYYHYSWWTCFINYGGT